MNKFKVVLIVPATLLSSVVDLVQGEGILKEVTLYEEERPLPQGTVTRVSLKDGLAYPNTERVWQFFKENDYREYHVIELAKLLEMPQGTISSSLHWLGKANRVTNTRRGYWQRRLP